MNVKFTPNPFAKRFFGLKLDFYTSTEGVSALLEHVLGKEDYQKYMVAQDPFHEPVTKPKIRIALNLEEFSVDVPGSIHSVDFVVIGTVEKIPE